ncbi:MAG: SMP-30/gluconolactonase/LRE family protein, partial [Myxococcales bacterium]|nr:SMP-30/gluconolactonase/LRE family protein [Myxococcales bacterium]
PADPPPDSGSDPADPPPADSPPADPPPADPPPADPPPADPPPADPPPADPPPADPPPADPPPADPPPADPPPADPPPADPPPADPPADPPDPAADPADPFTGMGVVQPVATGLKFTEGPVWLASEGALLFTDLEGDQVWRYDPGVGTTLVRDVAQRFTNGMTLDQSGRRIECQHTTQQVVRIEADGSETVLASAWNGTTLNSPNDVVIGGDGTLYFTDPTIGKYAHLGNVQTMPLGFRGVYRIDPQGQLHLVDDTLADPTGVALSPAGDVLYVADWGTGWIHRYPVLADGSLGAREAFSDWAAQPDGMCVDVQGNVYVASNSGLRVLRPDGSNWGLLALPHSPMSNCAFGGADWSTLYLTDVSAVYAVSVAIPGAPPFGG